MTKEGNDWSCLPGTLVKTRVYVTAYDAAYVDQSQLMSRKVAAIFARETLMLVLASSAVSGLSPQCLVIDPITCVYGWVWTSHLVAL